jgi:hypothetical protein
MKSLPVLISYAYERCFDWERVAKLAPELDLLIDCGAYTVHKKGKKISLEEYYDFLARINFPVVGYFALDSIGDPVKTWSNFIDMKENGFEPIPIFTRGDELRRLDEYYNYSDIVALGGLWAGGENDPGYVKYIMEEGFRGRRVHWLGFAVHNLMLYFKPTSVDAINWKRALIYGRLSLWTGTGFIEAHRKEFGGRRLPSIARTIRKLGFDPYLLKKEESWRGVHTYAHTISTISYFRYIRLLKRRIGTDFYFVVNAQHELDFLYEQFKKGE